MRRQAEIEGNPWKRLPPSSEKIRPLPRQQVGAVVFLVSEEFAQPFNIHPSLKLPASRLVAMGYTPMADIHVAPISVNLLFAEYVRWLLRLPNLTAGQFRLAVAIAAHADEAGVGFPSARRLREMTGIAKDHTIYQGAKALERAGVLTKEANRGRASTYRLPQRVVDAVIAAYNLKKSTPAPEGHYTPAAERQGLSWTPAAERQGTPAAERHTNSIYMQASKQANKAPNPEVDNEKKTKPTVENQGVSELPEIDGLNGLTHAIIDLVAGKPGELSFVSRDYVHEMLRGAVADFGPDVVKRAAAEYELRKREGHPITNAISYFGRFLRHSKATIEDEAKPVTQTKRKPAQAAKPLAHRASIQFVTRRTRHSWEVA